jgi:hypothetical protein
MRIFGPKRNEVTGGWRKLHKEELHNMYYSLSIIRMTSQEDEIGRACRMHGGEEECIWDIGGKVKRKKTTRKTKI